MYDRQKNEGGSVLILTLWTLVFLAALVMAVGSYVSAGVVLATSSKARTLAYNLARSGVEFSAAMLASDTNNWDGFNEPWRANKELFAAVPMAEGVFSIRYVSTDVNGVATTNYGVLDEESKININRAEKRVLETVIRRAGGVDVATASDLAASIMDWRDLDDDVLTGGAERGYYQGLSASYSCRNGDFQSLLELTLVKGMTSELYRKVSPFLTVYGDGKVNINTAGEVVLAALAAAAGGDDGPVCESIARKAVSFRNGGGSFTDASGSGVLAQLRASGGLTGEEEPLVARMMMFVTIRSTCFGGMACGRLKGSQTDGAKIDFVYDRGRNVICSWREE